jgi:hypothetical protein
MFTKGDCNFPYCYHDLIAQRRVHNTACIIIRSVCIATHLEIPVLAVLTLAKFPLGTSSKRKNVVSASIICLLLR